MLLPPPPKLNASAVGFEAAGVPNEKVGAAVVVAAGLAGVDAPN